MTNGRRHRGLIGYFDRDGVRTGGETFSVNALPEGERILRAQCEMNDVGVSRDAVLALNSDWQPREAYVRLVKNGSWIGSGWYRLQGDDVRLDAETPAGARTESRIFAQPPGYFGTHALVNDGWATALGAGRHTAPACSLAADGATEPRILVSEIAIEPLGTEMVTVPAGKFATEVFDIAYQAFPPLRTWVFGADRLLVRMTWAELAGVYELLELDSEAK